MFGSLFGRKSSSIDLAFAALSEALEDRETIVVDVREPNEFRAGHVPNAVNHPLSCFDPAKLPRGKKVVLMCQAGGRSGRALAQAMATGRDDLLHYPGGFGDWQRRGGKVVV